MNPESQPRADAHTPRTDTFENAKPQPREWPQFARTLERETARLTAENKALRALAIRCQDIDILDVDDVERLRLEQELRSMSLTAIRLH